MRFAASIALALAVPVIAGTVADKPKLTLRANPTTAFSPARIVVTADLTGGKDDDAQLYCPSIEWDWGDGTKSEDSADCEPFQAGKSEIKRHFTADHTFEMEDPSGGLGQQPDYRDVRIQLRLKKAGKVVVSGGTTVKIRPETAPTTASPQR